MDALINLVLMLIVAGICGAVAQALFGVKRVVTRINDPIRSDTFTALGLRAISPTVIGANAFFEEITGERADALVVEG